MIEKVNYVDIGGLDEFQQFIDDNPHNNGKAWWHIVEDPEIASYPEIEKWLINNGLQIGDRVLFHSEW